MSDPPNLFPRSQAGAWEREKNKPDGALLTLSLVAYHSRRLENIISDY